MQLHLSQNSIIKFLATAIRFFGAPKKRLQENGLYLLIEDI